MANVKISNLTAATTPVAGTEVLPIVQSGATVKVSIANLTPGLDTITAAKGGTGQTSYAVGDLLYASTTTALSKLADVATGNALISGGVSTAPSWGKIGLTTHVSGVLPTANGGTNLSSFTANGVVYASSTSALTTGSALVFDGSNLGLGVTPPTSTDAGNITIKGGSTLNFSTASGNMAANATFNSGWKYIATAAAVKYTQSGAEHQWFNAASGTAGNAITFTQAMTLDASGNLGVGSTSPSARLELAGVSSPQIALNGSANTGYRGISYQYNGTQYGFAGLNVQNGEFLIRSGESGQSGYYLAFQTNGSERARIDSSGNLLVGTTSGSGYRMEVTTSGVTTMKVSRTGLSGANSVVDWFYNTTNVGSVAVSSTATSYNTSSDYRLKNSVAPMTGALAKVAALKPCTYKWNADDSDGEGFIAHELAEVVPNAVTGEKDAVNEDGTPKYQGIDTSFLVATLTAAIQEMKAIIDTQASTITQLQADVAALKGA